MKFQVGACVRSHVEVLAPEPVNHCPAIVGSKHVLDAFAFEVKVDADPSVANLRTMFQHIGHRYIQLEDLVVDGQVGQQFLDIHG